MEQETDRLMTPKEVARYLRLSESVLYEYRAMGVGPNYLKIGNGRLVRYRLSDIEKWLESQQK